MRIKLILLTLCLFFYSCTLFAQTTVNLTPPLADATIYAGFPTTNYGTNTSIMLERSNISSFIQRSVIKFDLSFSGACTITSAKLYLKQNWMANILTVEVFRITKDWTETGVTWNSPWAMSKPGGEYFATKVGTFTIQDYNASPFGYKTDVVDLTASVQAFVNGTYPNYGWLLKMFNEGNSTELAGYASKDNATVANRPRLEITYTGAGCTPLPIQLLTFDAKKEKDNKVSLTWQTATETNNDFFTIESSTDAKSWKIIKQIKGAGNSSKVLSYAATDENPYQGIVYYRLKQTDFDGKFSYSSIVDVNMNGAQAPLIIYPNPANDKIIIEGFEEDEHTIKIYNLLGTDVSSQTPLIKNDSFVIIDITALTSGLYYIKTATTVTKIYKQ